MECASEPDGIAAGLPAASFARRSRGGADRSHRAVPYLRRQLRSLGRHALGSVLAGLAVLAIGAPEQANAQTPNTPATGAPTISGTLHVGRTLTASPGTIADDDGLTNASYSYQWILVDGTDEEDISGATGAIYILNAAAVGKKIKVRASFTDDAGNAESRTSAPTATVEYGAPPTLGVVAGVGQGVLVVDAYGGGTSCYPQRIPLFAGGSDCAERDVATRPDPQWGTFVVLPGGEGSDERHDPYLPGACGSR